MKEIIFEKGNRKAVVYFSEYVNSWAVTFFYDGFCDFEWKRGSHGLATDLCNSKEQAIRKAKYYINK